MQTLKASGEHGVARLEHNAPVDASPGTSPALDVERHRGSPAFDRLMAVLAEGGALKEVFRTEVDRVVRLIDAPGGGVVEAALDEGRVVAGAAVHPLREVEFEWKSGPLPGLFSVAWSWVAAHGLWLDIISKAERGTLLSHGQAHRAAASGRPPVPAAVSQGTAWARAVVASCLSQVLPNASAVASGSGDPAHVHQLRVGLRRLRRALRQQQKAAPGPEATLSALYRSLGAGEVPPRWQQVQSPSFQQVLLSVQAFALGATGAG